MITYNINGKAVEQSDATVDIHDLAILRGYGVFDFLRTYNKVPFHLTDHILRLKKSAKLLGMNYVVPVSEIKSWVMDALERNDSAECNIRILVTGGTSPDNLMPSDDLQTIVIVSKLHALPADYYTTGVKITTAHVERFIPGAKSTNYIPGIISLKEAKSQGAIEAIYTDSQGYLLEGTTSNLFAVFGDTLVTPPESKILPGITRQVVIELVKNKYELEVRNIHQDEIRLMDEAFITASNKEIIPVTSINAVTIGQNKPAPMTMQIMQAIKKYTEDFRNE